MQQPQPSAEAGHVHGGECAQPAPVQQGPQPAHNAHHHHVKPRPRRGFFRRFITGYLIITGALVNIFVLSQLLLLLLEFLGKRFSVM
jgi:hypothetical protein